MRQIFRDSQGNVRNGWKVLGFTLLFLAASKAFNVGLRPALPFLHAHRDLLPTPVITALIALIPTLLCLKLEKAPLAGVGLALNRTWAKEALLGTGLGAGLILGVALVIRLLGGFHLTFVPGMSLGALAAGIWLYVWVAIFEEVLFRGYLFQRLARGLGDWPAQALLALLFALGHWGNPGMHGATKLWATLNIAVAAVMLGLAYLKTRSLALPMGLHLGWNWAQGCLLGFGVSGNTGTATLFTPTFHGRPEWLTGGAFGPEASLPSLIVLIAFCVGLALWKPSKRSLLPGGALAAEPAPAR